MDKLDNLEKASKVQHVVIVGAGIKGLFAARQLCRLGYNVTVLERAKQPGGKIKTVYSSETLIEENLVAKDINLHSYSCVEMGAMRILDNQQETLK